MKSISKIHLLWIYGLIDKEREDPALETRKLGYGKENISNN